MLRGPFIVCLLCYRLTSCFPLQGNPYCWLLIRSSPERSSFRSPRIPSEVNAGLSPVDRSYSRPCRHPFGGDNHDLASHLQDQLPQVVEEVVNLRVGQVVELDPTGCSVHPPGHLAVGSYH